MRCPNCKTQSRQVKNGFNGSGSQKYLCKTCGHKYTPEPKVNGYPPEIRQFAIRMYVEGSSYGSIARILKVNPQSAANWVQSYTAKVPSGPLPAKVQKAELDELYTFVGKKKTKSIS